MKIVQISEHVWKCSQWIIIPMSAWLVQSERGLTLVDAGIPLMAGPLLKQIERMGLPLEQIVLTHGHSDHVGSLNKIVERYPVPVYVHEAEIPYMEGRQPYPRRKKAEQTVRPGLVRALDMASQPGGLTPYATPGHSPGHVAYYHEQDGVLLAGDLFTSKRGQLHRPMPMFTADMKQAVGSGALVEQVRPKLVSVCHGGEVQITDPQRQAEVYRTAALASL